MYAHMRVKWTCICLLVWMPMETRTMRFPWSCSHWWLPAMCHESWEHRSCPPQEHDLTISPTLVTVLRKYSVLSCGLHKYTHDQTNLHTHEYTCLQHTQKETLSFASLEVPLYCLMKLLYYRLISQPVFSKCSLTIPNAGSQVNTIITAWIAELDYSVSSLFCSLLQPLSKSM